MKVTIKVNNEEKLFCTRCGKEIEHYFYFSEIDRNKICEDCHKAEHPKELAKQIAELKAENERLKKRRTLSEKEFQQYCAYKIIEPEIKGCLERERQYQKQLKEKDEEIEKLKKDWKRDVRTLEYALINLEDKLKINTKQVCEKIRDEIVKYDLLKDSRGKAGYCMLDEIIKQIEEGK